MSRGPDPRPLAPTLARGLFTVSAALAAGESRERLRSATLDQRIHGVRADQGAADDLETRCRMLAARMPAAAFISHSTAALLLGAPLPWRVEADGRVHVTVPAPARAPHATGIRGHSLTLREGDVIESEGLRRASPARIWCDLATQLSLPDLVAAGDFLVHRRTPHTSIGELADRIRASPRFSRSAKLVRAVGLLSDRAESRPESLLRVLLVLGGLPEPEINHVQVNTETGRHRRTDLSYRHLRFAIEYQGDYHRTKTQWRRDMTRRSRLEAEGWYVLELNADDLGDPAELLARIRSLLRRHAARP